MTKDRLAALQAVSVAHSHHHHHWVNPVFEREIIGFLTTWKSDDDDDDLIDIMRKKIFKGFNLCSSSKYHNRWKKSSICERRSYCVCESLDRTFTKKSSVWVNWLSRRAMMVPCKLKKDGVCKCVVTRVHTRWVISWTLSVVSNTSHVH